MSLYWRRYRTRQKAIEKKYVPLIYKEIRAQYKTVIDSVRTNGVRYTRNNLLTVIPIEGIAGALKKMYRAAAYVEANYVLSSLIGKRERKSLELKKGKPDASFGVGFDSIAGVVDEYFKLYQLKISALPISETTSRHVQDYLFNKIDQGMSLDDAIKGFRELALTGGPKQSPRSRTRAMLIAQTEATTAMSFGGLIGAYMSGVDLDKIWVTSADEQVRGARHNVRYPHTVLDGQVTSLFGSFQNGEAIRWPGDPEASPANRIGCRCSQYFRKKKRPQPRVARNISRFLTDFFLVFMMGNLVTEIAINE